MSLNSLLVRSGQGDYPVDFPSSVDQVVESLLEIPRGVVVVDRKVEQLYTKQLAPLLKKMPHLLLDATEEEKSLAGVVKVANWLQSLDANKRTILITIGGGIIQDIASLTAHIYYRGISWIFVPTTLLSMSDSCIGAKCGVNLNQYKNQLGAFHSPKKVLICTEFTNTLADADVKSGYGEILKLMFTGSHGQLDELGQVCDREGLRNSKMSSLLRSSLEVKKRVIEIDEYEKDLRRILNFGHTFGHALESLTHHEVPHGVAVAWGMDLVNYIAMKQGLLAEKDFLWTHEFIKRHLSWKLRVSLRAEDFIQAARRDKKAADGHINLVLARAPGKLEIVTTKFDVTLEAMIADYLAGQNVFCCN